MKKEAINKNELIIDIPTKINGTAISIYVIVLFIILFLNMNLTIPVYQTGSGYVSLMQIKKERLRVIGLGNISQIAAGKEVTISIHPLNAKDNVQIAGIVESIHNDTAYFSGHFNLNKMIFQRPYFADLTMVRDRLSIFQKIKSSFIGSTDKDAKKLK